MTQTKLKGKLPEPHYAKTDTSAITPVITLGIDSIDLRDNYTAGHCRRVRWVGAKLLNSYIKKLKRGHKYTFKKLKKQFHMVEDQRHKKKIFGYKIHPFNFAALVHDLGKISWYDYLLCGPLKINKSDPSCLDLNFCLKQHPIVGSKALFNCFHDTTDNKNNYQYLDWIGVIFYHHKNFDFSDDTSSYPSIEDIVEAREIGETTNHKEKEEILFNKEFYDFIYNRTPLFAIAPKCIDKICNGCKDSDWTRLMLGALKVADVLDALTSYRPYRGGKVEDYEKEKPWKTNVWPEAINIIKKNRGTVFHPNITDILLENETKIQDGLFDFKINNQSRAERIQNEVEYCERCKSVKRKI